MHIGSGTGFLCEYKKSVFLVTNWHVVSGRHFQKKTHLHSSLALPGSLEISAHVSVRETREREGSELSSVECTMRLSEDQSHLRQFTHPIHGDDVDVVAFPLGLIPGFDIERLEFVPLPIYQQQDMFSDVIATKQFFIPGYPELRGNPPNRFPIYKVGYIASEPQILGDPPYILIDGKTRKGWSGSPVLLSPAKQDAFGMGGWTKRVDGKAVITNELVLFAIYSGRDEEYPELLKAELAMAWLITECLIPILDQILGSQHLVAGGVG